MELLPALVHIAQGAASSERVRLLIEMNQVESRSPGPGSEFVIARLVELLLVEILRSQSLQWDQEPRGLLAGLADPVTKRLPPAFAA